MVLPKYDKKRMFKKDKLKICQEQGCGREFYGHPISKYCSLHNSLTYRKKRIRIRKPVTDDNIIFNHKFTSVAKVEFQCGEPGCRNKYTINIYPKQTVYPKYCEKHRNAFKRICFRKRKVNTSV